eukprot:6254035-Alexandrium_andersonii.AAC.1
MPARLRPPVPPLLCGLPELRGRAAGEQRGHALTWPMEGMSRRRPRQARARAERVACGRGFPAARFSGKA